MNQTKLNRISELINQEIDKGKLQGASILICKDNKEVFQENYGFADREKGIKVKKDTIYRIFSMSKPITAVAAMILYERGLLDLLSPLSDYLPAFHHMKVITEHGLEDAKSEITIQHLLNMTSGIVYPDSEIEAGRRMAKRVKETFEAVLMGEQPSTQEICNLFAEVPLEFHPGEDWRYGASADVMGAVIEVVSGKKFSEFLQEEIFEPLGMVDTGFYVPKEKQDRFSKLYTYDLSQNKLVSTKPEALMEMGFFDFTEPPSYESGGGGLYSTLEDYSKFAGMLVNSGELNGVQIIGRNTVRFLSENQLTQKQLKSYNWDSVKGYGYSNFMRTLMNKGQAASNGSLGEFGWDGLAGTYFFVDPLEKMVVIYMQQNIEGGDKRVRRGICSIVYGALDK